MRRCASWSEPHEVPGWEETAEHLRSFYLTPAWSRYCDGDVSREEVRYYAATTGSQLNAVVPMHHIAREPNRHYVPGFAASPNAEPWYVLGGRRGYLSGVAAHPQAPRREQLRSLMAILERIGHDVGQRWWWPFLPAGAARLVAEAARESSGIEPVVQLVDIDATATVACTVEAFTAALASKQRRTNFRREMARFAESGLEVRQLDFATDWRLLPPLLANVQQRHGDARAAADHEPFLARQAQTLADNATTIGCFRGPELVGFSLMYSTAQEITVRMVGMDYDVAEQAGLYGQLSIHQPLRLGLERGISRIHLGAGSLDAKCRRGAKPRPLYAVSLLAGGNSNDLDALAPDLPARERVHLETRIEQELARIGNADGRSR